MVDSDRVLALLQHVRSAVAELRTYAAEDPAAVRSTRAWLPAVKYHFLEALEGCVDVAQHVCAYEGWGPPDTNADAMRVLGKHGVLDPDLAERMARAVGFRNVLVHEYRQVDDDLVIAHLSRLDDLDAFVAATSALL